MPVGYLLLWLGYDRHAWVLGFKLLSAHTHSRRREKPRGQTADCSTRQATERRSSPVQQTQRGKGNRRRDPDSLYMAWPPLWGISGPVANTVDGPRSHARVFHHKIFKRTVVPLKYGPKNEHNCGPKNENKQGLPVKLNSSVVMLLPCNIVKKVWSLGLWAIMKPHGWCGLMKGR